MQAYVHVGGGVWCSSYVCFQEPIYFILSKGCASSSRKGLFSQVSWSGCSSVPDSLCNEGHTLLCSAVALRARVLQVGVVVLVVVPVCCPSILDQACWVKGSGCPVNGPDARTFLFSVVHTTQPEAGCMVLEGQRL